MSKLDFIEFKDLPYRQKIDLFNSLFNNLELSNETFDKYGLIRPIDYIEKIRLSCPKCRQRKHSQKPKTKFSPKEILGHLYSSYHDVDKSEYPSVDESVKLVSMIVFLMQMGIIGERI